MAKLSPRDLLTGCFSLIKVSKQVPTGGMTIKFVCDEFDTKIAQKVSNAGTTFTVRGRGWAYTVVVQDGDVRVSAKTGLDADIDQTLTLARIAA